MGQLTRPDAPCAANPRLHRASVAEFLPPGARAGGLRVAGFEKRAAPNTPLITVITAVFNGAATVARAIDSVLAQTYDNVEYLVIDGGSGDLTTEILAGYADRIDLWLSEPDRGIYDAWNKGLALAKGDFIAFLGADDRLMPDAIESYVEYLQACNLDKEYVCSRVRLVRGGETVRILGSPWRWRTFARYMNVAHVGSLHARRLFQRVGQYDPDYRIAGDYELLLRARSTLNAGYLDKITAEMTVGGVSNTNPKVFAETFVAKVKSGGRSPWLSRLEQFWARCKFEVRSRLNVLHSSAGRAA